ncbi:unnamed protein product [Acanthoscelides obtectus]|uniref:Uncharacterized protein n=1 Tax=Acanthoscelides obtectus TaxID=200917 RepID=A0A9P0P4C3_ACAOB|nr:unnamed protein product [Acanthoscelides obtectus]CAH2013513.1 unnamed protein product [Acanthoscelides obtectus]CAK1634137.1 hypothetical protein AOBTE_LOCUS8628 [Acanthoscelides obtectus]CAK1634193.1 hypothetical protein AOBTE_LOCUS8653 [Acanthoscelides obtectus]
MRPLMFLLKLAWDCRYRLPLLITIGFMVLDVEMQLDIDVQTRRVRRPVQQPRTIPQLQPASTAVQPAPQHDGDISDTRTEDSWTTVDETTDEE